MRNWINLCESNLPNWGLFSGLDPHWLEDTIAKAISGQASVFHASPHAAAILDQGFRKSYGMIWFAEDPLIGTEGDVIEARINITNPYYWQRGDEEGEGFVNQLIAAGYDGMILPSNVAFVDFVVFSEKQVISAEAYQKSPEL
jgi:hypothetical protein